MAKARTIDKILDAISTEISKSNIPVNEGMTLYAKIVSSIYQVILESEKDDG